MVDEMKASIRNAYTPFKTADEAIWTIYWNSVHVHSTIEQTDPATGDGTRRYSLLPASACAILASASITHVRTVDQVSAHISFVFRKKVCYAKHVHDSGPWNRERPGTLINRIPSHGPHRSSLTAEVIVRDAGSPFSHLGLFQCRDARRRRLFPACFPHAHWPVLAFGRFEIGIRIMKVTQTFKLAWIVATTALLLSACGGGSDGGAAPSSGSASPTTGTSPNAPTPSASALPPQTSVPAPSYVANSTSAQIYSVINDYRQALGVGLMKQDVALDAAAVAHANYEATNLSSGAIQGYAHNENPSLPSFTGASPLARAHAAGAPKNAWVGEVVGGAYEPIPTGRSGTACAAQWLNTIYHLQGVTSNSESMGIGIVSITPTTKIPGVASTCVVDMGTSTGVTTPPDPNNPIDGNGIPASGGQQFAPNLIVHSPYSNETNVVTAMNPEVPNPAPDLSSPGRPIMVRMNVANDSTLTIANYQLTDNTGATVPARILVSQKSKAGSTANVYLDPNNLIYRGVAFLLPLTPLKPNTQYTVTFAGARDGTSMSTSWSFTTGAQ
jgi:uncharacterized protein YkwD